MTDPRPCEQPGAGRRLDARALPAGPEGFVQLAGGEPGQEPAADQLETALVQAAVNDFGHRPVGSAATGAGESDEDAGPRDQGGAGEVQPDASPRKGLK